MDIAETRRLKMAEYYSTLVKDDLIFVFHHPTLYGENSSEIVNISEALHSFKGLGFETDSEERFNSMLIGERGSY